MSFKFSTIMTLVLLFEIGIGIAAYEKRDWLKEQMEKSLNETLNDIKNDTSLLRPWNKLQYEVSTILNEILFLNCDSSCFEFLFIISSHAVVSMGQTIGKP